MRIAVDVLGGDHAPRAILEGVAAALRDGGFRAEELLLVGPEEASRAVLREAGVAEAPPILHTDEFVGSDEKPVVALRQKPNASIALCVGAVRGGEADGLVSFGNTGATVAASTMGLGLLEGLRRPAIAVSMEGAAGRFVLLDAGANPTPKPLHLAQYAVMGAAHARDLLAHARPRVGLLNIGGEANKGGQALKEAYGMIEAAAEGYEFVGNVEGNEIFAGRADVFVCDGFVGNVVLKVVEGFAEYLVATAAEDGSEVSGALRRLLGAADFSEVGAAVLLGVRGVVLIGHGRSQANAVPPALRTVRAHLEAGVNRHIVRDLALGAEAGEGA